MKMCLWLVSGVVTVVFSFPVWSDSIKIGEKKYENVIVTEGASCYYVSVPDDGSVLNVNKSDVSKEDVAITKDQAERNALYDKWREKSQGRNTPPTPYAVAPKPKKPVLLGSEMSVTQQSATPPAVVQRPVPSAQPVYQESREEELQRKQQQLSVDAKRRQNEAQKYRKLMSRRVITSQDARGGGGWNTGNIGYGGYQGWGGTGW